MYWYMFGIILLLGGCTTYETSCRKIYGSSDMFGSIGFLLFFIAFIYGFFVYSWWVPLLSVFLSIIFWMVINGFALKINQPLFSTGRGLLGISLGVLYIVGSFWK